MPVQPRTVAGWRSLGATLRDDGEGHAKGWDWAEAMGMTEETECGGRSDSFIEGCQMYCRELAREQGGGGSAVREDESSGGGMVNRMAGSLAARAAQYAAGPIGYYGSPYWNWR